MATDSNLRFHHNHHPISFQSGVFNGSSESISSGNSGDVYNNLSRMISSQNLPSYFLLDQSPGLKHDAGFSLDWSVEEQHKLEEGLVKFANEPTIMKCIKIAATLRDKTVRDVALRCRWMTKKENARRKKIEERYSGKKMKDKKVISMMMVQEKPIDVFSNASIVPDPHLNMVTYPIGMPQVKQHTGLMPYEVGNTMNHLLEENALTFRKISDNLEALKIQDNIDLFCQTRSNIATILDEMSATPGYMNRMPPIPVSIEEGLIDTFISKARDLMFSTQNDIHLKQEPMLKERFTTFQV